MRLLLVALMVRAINLHNVEAIPSLSVEKEPLPQIVGTPFLHEHRNKEYLCGMVIHNPNSTHREKGRFIILFEAGTDWKVYEPLRTENEEAWEAWDQTYLEICEAE